jgi:formylglycine-generating enzyme required for sulfatase activity
LRTVRAEVPQELEELVDACLATDPNERMQNAGDIARALTGHSPVSGGHTTSTRLRTQKKSKRGNLITYGVITGVVAFAAAFAYISSQKGGTTPTKIDVGMVMIPAGTYTIGSNDDSLTRPVHAVSLGAYGIDKHEVTVGEYDAFVSSGKVQSPWTTRPDSMLPVTGVKLAEAQNFCLWRHGAGGRLPSEEEWEAAARGASARRYPWGNEWNPAAANIASSGRKGPAPVGSFSAGRTPEGVEELIGNVWEWTSTPFKHYDDRGSASSGFYVIRGGGFNAIQTVANAVFRGRSDPGTDRANLAATGFRCAMTPR